MKIPDNCNLPFFAYGIFKPSQICYYRIKDLVNNTKEIRIKGNLYERDGVPLLIDGHDYINGSLIYFNKGSEQEAYNRIIEIEPDKIYQWEVKELREKIYANVLMGKRHDRGSSPIEHCNEWDGAKDPFFHDAMREIEIIMKENSTFDWNNSSLFKLQMAYMLLWSSIERYASLKYHLGKNVMEKLNEIHKEDLFKNGLLKYVSEYRTVYRSADLDNYTLNKDKPKKSFEYYYQVRSNVVHRGKTVTKDFEILQKSLAELFLIFKDMLDETFNNNN